MEPDLSDLTNVSEKYQLYQGGDFKCAGSMYSIPPSGMENSHLE